MKTKVKKFENGLRLVYTHIEKTRPASIYIGVNVGSIDETPAQEGMAHLVEHLSFQGTKTRTAKEIRVGFEDIGGYVNAYTTHCNTCFLAASLNDKFEDCVEMLSDMVFNSTYDEEFIKKERLVIYNEIDMHEDKFSSVAFEGYAKNMYQGTNYAKKIIGSKETLEKITKKDIIKFVEKHYVAENIVVSMTAGIGFSKAKKLVEKYILPNISTREKPNKKTQHIARNKNRFTAIEKNSKQYRVVIGFPADPSLAKNGHYYSLMDHIIGGGTSSRLFDKIREEKGLVYGISCWRDAYPTTSSVVISFGTKEENLEKAMDSIKEILDDLTQNGVTKEELERAKVFRKSGLFAGIENSNGVCRSRCEQMLNLGKIKTLKGMVKALDKTTVEDVDNLIKRTFDYKKVCGCILGEKPQISLFDRLK